MRITAIIPTFNEEDNIEAAIKSVAFADEVIVIDSYSTDNTFALAKKAGVKTIQRVFDDFSTQKNFAIDRASNDWIYVLDADERVTDDLRAELEALDLSSTDKVGFFVYRTFYFIGRKINHGGWERDKVIRLFNRNFCRYNGNLVHEVIKANGDVGFCKNKLEHFSYRGFDHYIAKLNHYAALRAKRLLGEGRAVNFYHVGIKPPARFFIHYYIRRGFLDGFPGFVLASTQAYGVLTRYIKLWSLKKNLQ